MMVFHVTCELNEGEPSVGSRNDSSNLSELGKMFLSIRGVEKVAVNTYTVAVVKNPAFSWSDVQPQVVAILEEMVSSYKLLQVDYTKELKEKELSWRRSLLDAAEKTSRPANTKRGPSGPSKPQS
jgi:hypothetical protein